MLLIIFFLASLIGVTSAHCPICHFVGDRYEELKGSHHPPCQEGVNPVAARFCVKSASIYRPFRFKSHSLTL